MANSLFNVEGYVTEDALPLFANMLGVTRTFSQEYVTYADQLNAGIRGAKFNIPLPTRFTPAQTLAFNTLTDGFFSERQFSITITEQRSNPFQYTDVESAVFRKDKVVSKNAKSAINEIANEVEKYNIGIAQNTGYRFQGNPIVQPNQLQTVSETDEAINRFQSFGSPIGGRAYYVVPMVSSSRIIQTSFQQFVLKRNEELSLKGEIGMLGGVEDTMFLKSNFLNVHQSGTASTDTAGVNASSGYTIVSVTPNASVGDGDEANNTSVIELSGMNPGDTIVVNDLLDIGALNTANPLAFLTFTGYQTSENAVQCRVLIGDTVDGGGLASITVQPALVFDGTNTDPFRNLKRAIIPGTDTIRFVQPHRAGLLYYGDYMFFVSPDLPDMEPFPSASVRDDLCGVTMRAYYGAVFGGATKQFVHDIFIGSGGAPEGAARLIFPIN